jgi:hypothetical protein
MKYSIDHIAIRISHAFSPWSYERPFLASRKRGGQEEAGAVACVWVLSESAAGITAAAPSRYAKLKLELRQTLSAMAALFHSSNRGRRLDRPFYFTGCYGNNCAVG